MSFDLQPTLIGELVELRPLRADDFDDLYSVASDPLIWEQHPVKNRYEEAVFRQFLQKALDSGGALRTGREDFGLRGCRAWARPMTWLVGSEGYNVARRTVKAWGHATTGPT